MARNPIFALLWIAVLFVLAWPIAAACAGVGRLIVLVCRALCLALLFSAPIRLSTETFLSFLTLLYRRSLPINSDLDCSSGESSTSATFLKQK